MYKDQAPKPNLYSFFFVLILLLAAFLRFYCLTCSSLWHDEGNTWALMGRSYAEIAAAAAADIHPPGYYWLLKAWTSLFGADSFGLRSFSAVTGVATVAIVYAIGRQIVISDQWSVISGPRSVVRGRWSTVSFPLLAAFLAAVNPFQIFYSQEARMYALLALESAILFWAVRGQLAVGSKQLAEKRKSEKAEKRGSEGERERGSEQATRTTHYVIYFVAAAAGLWTHYSFPVVIAAAVLAYSWQWLRLWKLSVISDQSSVISYQSPIPDPRSPVPSPQSPIPDPRSPVPDPRSPIPSPQSPVPSPQSPIPFLAVNALALLAFLPWLPTAVDRVLNWPAGGDVVSLAEGIRLTVQTLLIGPIRTAPDLDWPWLLLAGGAPILGIWALRRTSAGITLGVWLLAPILLMFGLGLFSDAFLKFLIIAAPVWSLLTAAAPFALPKKSFTDASTLQRFNASRLQGFNASTLQRFNASTLQHFNASTLPRLLASLLILSLSLLLAAGTLPGYYDDDLARDNYAGIARTVAALADPAQDLVILNAPGQAEVWRYYDPGLPVLALPQQRPPDRAATEALLVASTADRRQIFALFWALNEADPDGMVEGWLDAHAFKGLESWQGNVRFVRYSLPVGLICEPLDPAPRFGDLAQLAELCRTGKVETVAAGESLLIGLRWQALTATDRRYKVTIQLLDGRNQVIAQRDGEPAGGSLPTVDWQPGAQIVDNHALFIPPGTPPGEYRLILALYDAEHGARLSVAAEDALLLGQVEIVPGAPLPPDILPIHHRLDARLGPLTLIGYDAYRRGFAHAPETPLSSGDLLHVTLYWQAPDPLPVDWPADLTATLTLGDQTFTAPLAGGLYPTADWPAGAFVRGEFDILYTGGDPDLWVQLGEARARLQRTPGHSR